jgi:hypothetical protein
MADRSALFEAERRRLDPLLGILTNSLQQHFRLSRDGIVSSEKWNDMVQAWRWATKSPGFRQGWHQWAREIYVGDFREFVDGLIREGRATG